MNAVARSSFIGVASRDDHTCRTREAGLIRLTTLHNRLPGSEGSLRGFLPSCNCLTGSQLLASAGVSSSLTQSRLDFHPPHLPSVYSTTTIYRHLPPYEGARTGPL
ncbi:hypothetical protein CDV36_016232 [Fusarium kuroshium]|uniref:Uncharacterized protein n=2 Tax=Fusarium solani species complex TaxID=232080 RepID=A0A3M2QWV1_9HYPO|nr:hypothetical protein CDV36_016232 [Fusarium kuroshium]RSL42719.1 hypothetical protein CEP51_016447 [Fusarium floridanum]